MMALHPRHSTRLSRLAGAEEAPGSDLAAGQSVMTSDGLPGRVTAVSEGPFPGSAEYHVTLDGGMGQGTYSRGQLRATGSATGEVHLASDDYPEMGSVLSDRPDPGSAITVIGSRVQAAYPALDDSWDDREVSMPWHDSPVMGPPGGEVHRGISLRLPPEVHSVVHDESRPAGERGLALARHLLASPHPVPEHGLGLGYNWTNDPDIAKAHAEGHPESPGSGYTPVVLHARTPDREELEGDPYVLRERHLSAPYKGPHAPGYERDPWSFPSAESGEVSVRTGGSVPLAGISWAPPGHWRSRETWNGGYGDVRHDPAYSHLDFPEGLSARASATYGRPDDARDEEYNGGPDDTGMYWAEPGQQEWAEENLGPQQEAPPPPWAVPPPLARLAQIEEACQFFGGTLHHATTINGTQVDDHGDAPGHGSVPRASDPDSYDERSTEGEGDPKWSDPADPEHKKIYNGATVGMFPEGISSGNGPGLPIGAFTAALAQGASRVPWTGRERTELHSWDPVPTGTEGDFVPSGDFTGRHDHHVPDAGAAHDDLRAEGAWEPWDEDPGYPERSYERFPHESPGWQEVIDHHPHRPEGAGLPSDREYMNPGQYDGVAGPWHHRDMARGDQRRTWFDQTLSHLAARDARDAAIAQLEDDYPPDALEWLRHASVTGPRYVPLRDLDWSDRHTWTSYKQPARVGGFLDDMSRKAAAGRPLKPALVVATPRRMFIGDGHHRGIAQLLAATEGSAPSGVWAYVASVGKSEGPWDTMHGRQLHAPSKDEDSTARIPGADSPPDEVAAFQDRVDSAVGALGEHDQDENSLEYGNDPAPSGNVFPDNQENAQVTGQELSGNDPGSSGNVRDWPLAGAQVTETGPARTQGRNDGKLKRLMPAKAALAMLTASAASPSFRFEFTASWRDVVAKARRIRAEGHVRITHASPGMVIGEVRGDHDTYESGIQRPPGRPQAIRHWACGCPWASFHQDESPATRYSGRPCSHVMALQYEAQARGMFGRPVAPDGQAPSWSGSDVTVKSWPPYEGDPHKGRWREHWLAPAGSLRREAAGWYRREERPGSAMERSVEEHLRRQRTGTGWETELVPNRHFVGSPASREGGVTHLLRGYVNGEQAGVIAAGASNNMAAWKVHNVHVSPKFRDQGVGEAMMDDFYDRVKGLGGRWVDHGRKTGDDDAMWRDYSEPYPEMNIHRHHPEEGWEKYFNAPRVHADMTANAGSFPESSQAPGWRSTGEHRIDVRGRWTKARGMDVSPWRGDWPERPVNGFQERGEPYHSPPRRGPWQAPVREPEPEPEPGSDRHNYGVVIGSLDDFTSCYYGHAGPCPDPPGRTAGSLRHPRRPDFTSRITPNPDFVPGEATHILTGYRNGEPAGQIHFSQSDDGLAYRVHGMHVHGAERQGTGSAMMDDLYAHVHRNGQWLDHGWRTPDGIGWWARYREPHPEVNVHHFPPDSGWKDYFDPGRVAMDAEHNYRQSGGRGAHTPVTWGTGDYPYDEHDERWTMARGGPAVQRAIAALIGSGEDPDEVAALSFLAATGGRTVTADQANSPWGAQNVSDHPPVKPYGATEPPNHDQDPGSYGSLAAPDPENWGEIQDGSYVQSPLSNQASRVLAPGSHESLPPHLHYPDMSGWNEDQEGFGYADRANTAGPSTAITPRDPQGIRMEESRTAAGTPFPYRGTIPQLDGALAELRDEPEPALPSTTGDEQEEGEELRAQAGIDGTMGDAQDVPHLFTASRLHGGCALCGLSPVAGAHIAAADGTIGGGDAAGAQEDQSPAATAGLGEFGAVQDRPDPYRAVRDRFRASAGTAMGDQARSSFPQSQQPSVVTQQPGMGSMDEPLVPDDQSIQTTGNQQWSGSGADSDEVDVPAGEPQGSLDDIVARFQRSAAAGQYGGQGSASASDSDIAGAARAFLSKTADVLPDAEAAELISEGRGQRARNLGLLRLEGTHYEDEDDDLARRGISLDDYDDDVISA